MKYHPILFSTPMVQAILEGRKTMTRRSIKKQFSSYNYRYDGIDNMGCHYIERITSSGNPAEKYTNIGKCPYGQPGDVLWVRETYQQRSEIEIKMGFEKYYHKASWEGCTDAGWKPSIYMPKEACRIFLNITDIKVERLQDISREDCTREGILLGKDKGAFEGRVDIFHDLWEKINGDHSWYLNPWVWVISFSRCEKPQNF